MKNPVPVLSTLLFVLTTCVAGQSSAFPASFKNFDSQRTAKKTQVMPPNTQTPALSVLKNILGVKPDLQVEKLGVKVAPPTSQQQTPAQFIGGSNGGGGNVVVCFNSAEQAEKIRRQQGIIKNEDLAGIRSIDLLEMYDMKVGHTPLSKRKVISMVSDNITENLALINSRYQRNFTNIASQYDPTMREILESTSFTKEPLNRRLDSNESVSFDGDGKCRLSTIAIQNGSIDDFIEVTIDGRLYNLPQFSTLNKVALYMHETLYAISRRNGAKDSLRAQRTNQMMLSTLEGETRSEWLRKISKYDVVTNKSDPLSYPSMTSGIPEQIYLAEVSAILRSEGDLKSEIFLNGGIPIGNSGAEKVFSSFTDAEFQKAMVSFRKNVQTAMDTANKNARLVDPRLINYINKLIHMKLFKQMKMSAFEEVLQKDFGLVIAFWNSDTSGGSDNLIQVIESQVSYKDDFR